ncbi:MAG TPA: DUF971 domain-containing protein [Nitrospinae bacterium]|nr:DUF971 domain-containing protein [Nitrospinota bacterium]
MTTLDQHHPVDLTLDKTARELRIEWVDGSKSQYGFDYLAAMCPCANCREKRIEMAKNPLHVVSGPLGPAEVGNASMVGRYALSITWQAGCVSGIYSFDYLRSIDPANAEKDEAGEAGSREEG